MSSDTVSCFEHVNWAHSMGPYRSPLSRVVVVVVVVDHRLWTSILHCHSPGVATVARRLRYSYSWLRLILVVVSTVATPGEWQRKIRTGGVRRLAVANASCLQIIRRQQAVMKCNESDKQATADSKSQNGNRSRDVAMATNVRE